MGSPATTYLQVVKGSRDLLFEFWIRNRYDVITLPWVVLFGWYLVGRCYIT